MYDLTKPAFGAGAEKVSVPKETPAEDSQPEVEKVEEPVSESVESVEETEEEQKVPYSRFKKFHDEAAQLRAEVAELRAVRETKSEPVSETELPEFWKELYGDSEQAIKAWKIQSQQNEALINQARQEAVEAVRNERYQEEERVQENLVSLDDHLEQVSAVAGRDLTEKEQSAILDIIDDYTPKGEDGSYAGALMSPDKAWEIYELKNQASRAPKAQARDNVASLSGSKTQGEPSIEAEQNKSWNPLDWNAYKKRI